MALSGGGRPILERQLVFTDTIARLPTICSWQFAESTLGDESVSSGEGFLLRWGIRGCAVFLGTFFARKL